MAYPNRMIALIADAEFLPGGEVRRTEARPIYHSIESQLLFIPPPLILTKTQRRIAVRRLARTPSYTPWELSIFESDAMPLYGESNPVMQERAVADSVPTTFSAVTYNAATPPASYQCLAANTSRKTFRITNTGNATVWGDLDAPSSAASRSFVIPAGQTYAHDDGYQGAVYIWSSVAAAQSCQVRDLVY